MIVRGREIPQPLRPIDRAGSESASEVRLYGQSGARFHRLSWIETCHGTWEWGIAKDEHLFKWNQIADGVRWRRVRVHPPFPIGKDAIDLIADHGGNLLTIN